MYYVYLLRSHVNKPFYVGSTGDLRRRYREHNSKQSQSTKAAAPWNLVYYEAFQSKTLALKRERSLKKYGRGLVELKKRLGYEV